MKDPRILHNEDIFEPESPQNVRVLYINIFLVKQFIIRMMKM